MATKIKPISSNSNPQSSVSNAGVQTQILPSRTMASDADRAHKIEADRQQASQDAIAEIKELERALSQNDSDKKPVGTDLERHTHSQKNQHDKFNSNEDLDKNSIQNKISNEVDKVDTPKMVKGDDQIAANPDNNSSLVTALDLDLNSSDSGLEPMFDNRDINNDAAIGTKKIKAMGGNDDEVRPENNFANGDVTTIGNIKSNRSNSAPSSQQPKSADRKALDLEKLALTNSQSTDSDDASKTSRDGSDDQDSGDKSNDSNHKASKASPAAESQFRTSKASQSSDSTRKEAAKTKDSKEEESSDPNKTKTTFSDSHLVRVIKDEEEAVIEPAADTVSNHEDIRITTLRKEIVKEEKAKLGYIQQRSEFTSKEQPIRHQIEDLKHKFEKAKSELEPFQNKQQSIEAKITQTEQSEESAATPDERHQIESQRWQLEDERHELEQQKWQKSKAAEAIGLEIKDKESELANILDEARSIDEAIENSNQRVRQLDLEITLVELSDQKDALEEKWVNLNEQKRQADKQLEEAVQNEQVIEEQIDQLRQNAIETKDLSVKHEFEEERRRLSLERRKLEQKRWKLEQKTTATQSQIESLKPQYQQALDAENEAKQELQNIKPSNKN
jgi:hypothetical protein